MQPSTCFRHPLKICVFFGFIKQSKSNLVFTLYETIALSHLIPAISDPVGKIFRVSKHSRGGFVVVVFVVGGGGWGGGTGEGGLHTIKNE